MVTRPYMKMKQKQLQQQHDTISGGQLIKPHMKEFRQFVGNYCCTSVSMNESFSRTQEQETTGAINK